MLPTRIKHKKTGSSLPKEFLKTVKSLFQKQFTKDLEGAKFDVFGALYPGEAVLCVTLAQENTLQAASLHLSTDLAPNVAESPEKVTEQLRGMVDVAASWFAQCFENGSGLETVLDELQDMDPNWQEIEWEGKAIFVKLNKTNYGLERAADDFLKKAGYSLDDDDDFDPDDPQELS